MLSVKSINLFDSSGISLHPDLNGSNFDRQLAITRADALLKTTRQYTKWQTIQQSDPAKAEQLAQIILKRHAYLAGKAPRGTAGRTHFDQLTQQLHASGIYLYKSHQFKQPLFSPSPAQVISNESSPNQSADMNKAGKNAMLQNLQSRYKNRDCLEFLANLLEDNGIAYYGKNGLANQLIGQARTQGKKMNAYLTGEGLTRKLSSRPITVRLEKDYKESFEQVWNRLKPHIRSGSILSFSSKSFGHTGLVDQIDDRWAYFNASGTAGKPETYQVKAEDLKPEVKSWFDRAQKQETFLNITIGAIDPGLAAQFQNLPAETRQISNRPIDLLASHRILHRGTAT